MGYPYTGKGFATRVDLTRQVYQLCNTHVVLSGSSSWGDNIRVNYKSGNTYNFYVTGTTTGNTAIVSINMKPQKNRSALQINPNTLPSGTGTDLEIDLVTGEVYRSASSKRYKYAIEDLDKGVCERLLQISPKKFKWIKDNRDDIGFIAEDFHIAGLNDWVTYNGPPSLNTVDGIKYKLITVALLELVKSLYKQDGSSQIVKNEETVQVVTSDYTTQHYRYLITKENNVTIILDPSSANRFYIKAMIPTIIKPHYGLIDEEYEEISLGKQSSIELLWSGTSWYVLSSDGLKTS